MLLHLVVNVRQLHILLGKTWNWWTLTMRLQYNQPDLDDHHPALLILFPTNYHGTGRTLRRGVDVVTQQFSISYYVIHD